jgi:antirestriction protein ArdC
MSDKYEKKSAMNEFSKMVLEALKESESEEKLKWVKPWRTIDCAYRNGLSKHQYSGLHNILACALSEFSDPRYLTFNQIRKAGGKLVKGSKATRLIAWKFSKKIQDDGTEKTIPFATSWCLFNVEQTEGLDLPPIDNDVMDENMEVNEDVIKIYDTLQVQYKHEKANTAAYYPKTDNVVLPHVQQYDDADQWCNTALHELVHWTAPRVGRDCSKYAFDVDERAMEELVAELGAMYLCMRLKINGYMNKQNLAYIKSWRSAAKGKNGDRFIYKACKLAEEASKYILKESGFEPEEESEEE